MLTWKVWRGGARGYANPRTIPYVGSFSVISFFYCPFDIIQKRLLNGKTAEATSIPKFYNLIEIISCHSPIIFL